jgi:hypothetical protein
LNSTKGTTVLRAHLHLEDDHADQGRRSATLELPNERLTANYEFDHGALGTRNSANPFLLTFFIRLMQEGIPLTVHGSASERLLVNLEELQDIWAKWLPGTYNKFDVDVDGFVPAVPAANGHRSAITAFSGGVDAGFCVAQHLGNALHHARADLQSALLIQGLDVPLSEPETFERTRHRAEAQLQGTGLDVLSVRSNFKELGQKWEYSFGLAVAACLMLFEDRYEIGLIGSSEPYDALVLPWGSSPVTDHLYSSGGFEVRHEGAGYSRTEKVGALLSHPQLVEHLRVCWAGDQMDRNCGECEKCVRTMLNFRVFTDETPTCFPNEVTPQLIRSITFKNTAQRGELQSILDEATKRNVDEWWTRELKRRLSFAQNSRDAVKAAPHRVKAHAKWRIKKAIGRA